MTQPVKAYVSWVAAVGSVAIGAAISECQFTHPVRFPIYFALAFLTSMIKIRFSRLSGTLSCSSLFAILAIVELDHTEAMLISIGAAAGQTLLNVRERPHLAQLVFNIAACGISTAAATGAKAVAMWSGAGPVPAACVAAVVFYAVNTLVTAAVLALLHGQTVRRVWRVWLHWTMPAFLVSGGAGVALFALNPQFQWRPPLLLIPATVLFQLWYRRAVVPRLAKNQLVADGQ